MAATQMNIRMDAALKESGNAALARLGYTPSQAVRALWEVITVQGALPPALVRALNSNGDMPSRQEDPTEMESTSGAEIVSSFYRRLGIDEPSSTPVDYAELPEMAADEQLASWGLSSARPSSLKTTLSNCS